MATQPFGLDDAGHASATVRPVRVERKIVAASAMRTSSVPQPMPAHFRMRIEVVSHAMASKDKTTTCSAEPA